MGRDTDAEPTLEELIAARDKVQREIEILQSGSPYQGSNRQVQVGGLMDKLEDTLSELEQCIAEWKSGDADSP